MSYFRVAGRKVAMRKHEKVTIWRVFAWRLFAFSPRKHDNTTWHKSATIEKSTKSAKEITLLSNKMNEIEDMKTRKPRGVFLQELPNSIEKNISSATTENYFFSFNFVKVYAYDNMLRHMSAHKCLFLFCYECRKRITSRWT